MTAYLVVTHTVSDARRYASEYAPLVAPLLKRHGIELIGAGMEGTALEGTANSALVFRAGTEESFHAFYHDADNAGPIALRHSITSHRNMVVVPAFRSSTYPPRTQS